MTPDTSKARKLIEEARETALNVTPGENVQMAWWRHAIIAEKCYEALELLPSWQEFDPEREETWPKEKKWCAVWINAGEGEPILDVFFWRGMPWNAPVICYYVLPLPPPYQKDKP